MSRLLLLLLFAGCASASAQPDDKSSRGREAFKTVFDTFTHPRCRNCHPAGDAPLQFTEGRPHAQNITRRSEKNGLACATCHRDKNGTRLNTPPGAPNWHLPPPSAPMTFEGRTPKQLCEQLKDVKQTGGRNLQELVHHVAEDPLVAWGWDPGPGRTPVPTPRDQVVAAMKTWVDTGAPCPE